jgi:DNA-binding transcriptional LysR family regulator
MVQPELRLIRYFVAVAEERNFTRAAKRLAIAQPPLSTAIRQLEEQLGVRLLDRSSRQVSLTAAGELLLRSGRELLRDAEEVFAAVRAVERDPVGLLKVGFSPAARFGPTPRLLAAWADAAPGIMIHSREDTTGALLRDVAHGRLDLALAFCAPAEAGVAVELLAAEPAVLHVRDDHPLAARDHVSLGDLRDEVLLVAGGGDSPGYTATVLELCRSAGVVPATVPDPYPDLGWQAVREGLGVVIYVAAAFPPQMSSTRLVPIAPTVTLPFHLAWRADNRSAALEAVLSAARAVCGSARERRHGGGTGAPSRP